MYVSLFVSQPRSGQTSSWTATLLDVLALGQSVDSQVSGGCDIEALPEVSGCQSGARQLARIEKTASRSNSFIFYSRLSIFHKKSSCRVKLNQISNKKVLCSTFSRLDEVPKFLKTSSWPQFVDELHFNSNSLKKFSSMTEWREGGEVTTENN